MSSKLLLLALSVAAISSCTTAYKTGQTPDDVYYSPARVYDEEDNTDKRDEVKKRTNSEEREIRMSINDPRWRNFDNDYAYNPYFYAYNSGYYYNPYYCTYPVYISHAPVKSPVKMINTGTYGTGYNNSNVYTSPKMGTVKPVRSYNNHNRTSTFGNVVNSIFSGNQNNSTNSSGDTRSYSPSGSSGNSSSSGASRPARNGSR